MISITSAAALREFAEQHELREDWHEPDERGVDALVAVGDVFDNAAADPLADFYEPVAGEPMERIPGGRAEHAVFLMVDGQPAACVNLADLFSFACGREG